MRMLVSLLVMHLMAGLLSAEPLLGFNSISSCKMPYDACSSLHRALSCGQVPACVLYWNQQDYIHHAGSQSKDSACNQCLQAPRFVAAHSGLTQNPLQDLASNITCFISGQCGTIASKPMIFSDCASCPRWLALIGQLPDQEVDQTKKLLCEGKSSPLCQLKSDQLQALVTLHKQGFTTQELCQAISADECQEAALSDQDRVALLDLIALTKGRKASKRPFLLGEVLPAGAFHGDACDQCKALVLELKSALESNKTRQQIEQMLDDQLCKLLPSAFQDICKTFVQMYVDTLVDMLDKELDPIQICTTIGLCARGPRFTRIFQTQSPVPSWRSYDELTTECEQCLGFYQSDRNLGQLTSLLSECHRFQDELTKSACQVLGQLAREMFAAGLLKGKSGQDKCTILGVCSPSLRPSNLMASAQVFPARKTDQDFALCDQCLGINVTDQRALCENVPGKFAPSCQSFVKVHADTFQALSDQLSRRVICSAYGLCDKKSVEKNALILAAGLISRPRFADKTSAETCSLCKSFVQDLANNFKNRAHSSDELLTSVIAKFCHEEAVSRAMTGFCAYHVRLHVMPMISLLNANVSSSLGQDTICPAIGLCDHASLLDQVLLMQRQRFHQKLVQMDRQLNCPGHECSGQQQPVTCDECQSVVESFQVKFADSAFEDKLENMVLDGACQGFWSAQCKFLVRKYWQELVKSIKKLKPQEACQLFEICPAKGLFHGEAFMRLLDTYSRVQQKTTQELVPVTPTDQAVLPCDICEHFVQKLIDQVDPTATGQEIEVTFDTLCETLPKSRKSQCKQIKERYLDKIIDELVQGSTAAKICQLIGSCDKVKQSEIAKDEVPGLCQLCEIIIHEVISIVGGNATAQAIEAALDEVCDLLPKTWNPGCEDFVDKYAAKIIEALVNGATPKFACMAIGLCTPFEEAPKPDQLPLIDEQQGDQCEICKWLVHYIYEQVNSTSSRDEIRKVLDGLCLDLPVSWQGYCTNMVDTYTDVIIDAIQKGYSEDQVCKAVKLCASSLYRPDVVNPYLALTGHHDEMECTECKFFISLVYQQLSKNATDEEIIKVFEKMCSFLPASWANKCDNLVDNYILTIIRLIKSQYSPEDICKEIGFCTSMEATILQCEKIVRQLETKTVNRLVDKVCLLIAEPSRAKCKLVVDERGSELRRGKSVFRACQRVLGWISSCDEAQPGVLCQSRELAANCGMTDYCQLMVWPAGSYQTQQNRQKLMQFSRMYSYPKQESGNQACSQGPTHYCKSVSSALSCGLNPYKHCYYHIWNQALTAGPKIPVQCQSREWACSTEQRAVDCGLFLQCFHPPAPLELESSNNRNCLKDVAFWCEDEWTQAACGTKKYCEAASNRLFRSGMMIVTQDKLTKCLKGPGFWCTSPDNAKLCDQEEFCESYPDSRYNSDHPEKCRQGPAEFCKNGDIAKKCQMTSWCLAKGYLFKEDLTTVCMQGPEFWCKSWENAKLCEAVRYCNKFQNTQFVEPQWQKEAGLKHAKITVDEPECYTGAKYWCKSYHVAKACGEKPLKFCQEEIWNKNSTLAMNVCEEQGPELWCQSKQMSKICRTEEYCNSIYLAQSQENDFLAASSPSGPLEQVDSTSLVKDASCEEKGKAYWCASKKLAAKCQATEFCENFVWINNPQGGESEPAKPNLPTECLIGPSYWCGSIKKARSCRQMAYCSMNVWNKNRDF